MKKYLACLSGLLLGGVLLSSAWPPINFFIGTMVGFVPLLFVEYFIQTNSLKWKKLKVFLAAFVCFSVWNYCGIHWVSNAHYSGVIGSVLVNSTLFSFVFLLQSQARVLLGEKIGAFAFVFFWLAWEYIEILDWDLSWPWFTMGYSLAANTWMIQWYEYTGALGGSLWLLIINLLVFRWLRSFYTSEDRFLSFKKLLNVIYVIVIPMLVSLCMYYCHVEQGDKAEFVVVQPNEDPYIGRFVDSTGRYGGPLNRNKRLGFQFQLAEELTSQNTKFVLFPESAIPYTIWKHKKETSPSVLMLKSCRSKYPDAGLLTGVSYKELFTPIEGQDIPADAHYSRSMQQFYKRYNSALCLRGDDSLHLYNKSRLVIGVERIPSYFVFVLRSLGDFDHDKGAVEFNPNNSIQEEREVFYSPDSTVKIAPIICYESIFGEFVGDYVKEGANVLGVITNEGWWGDTEGYKHLFAYSRMRAIETRRSVARSANTGWSGFIDQRGDVLQKSEFWKPAVLKQELQLNDELTFYTTHGNYIGRLSIPFAILLLINACIFAIRRKGSIPI